MLRLKHRMTRLKRETPCLKRQMTRLQRETPCCKPRTARCCCGSSAFGAAGAVREPPLLYGLNGMHFHFFVKARTEFAAGLFHIVSYLQINPEFRLDAEIPAETQGGVRAYFLCAADDLADSAQRHIDVLGQLFFGNVERLHEFFQQDISWCDWSQIFCH